MIYHPVTGETNFLKNEINKIIKFLKKTKTNYIIIYPNNDPGSDQILNIYNKYKKIKNFKFFTSLRFEYYITLLKNAKFIIGNSSSGVREAPSVGVPSINIGSRQHNRSNADSIINCSSSESDILRSIKKVGIMKRKIYKKFGYGNSAIKL